MALLPTSVTAGQTGHLGHSNQAYKKLNDLAIDVKADFGAAGDGATDDATAINNAISAASSAGGGIVYLPPGTYLTGKLTLATGVTLRGAGRGATTVKLKAGVNDNLVETTSFATLTGTDTTATPWGFAVENLTLDGNKTGQTAGTSHGLAVYGCGYRASDVWIVNCRSRGLWTEWATTTPSAALQPGGSMEALVTDFMITGCDGGAISHQGPHDTQFVNGLCVRNCADIAGDTVIDMPVDGRANGSVFSALHIWGGQYDYGWRINSSGIAVNDCQTEGAKVASVRFGASLSQIEGGKLFAGGATWQTATAIVTDAGVNNLRISCKVENLSGGVLDMSAGGGGNHHVVVHASYYGSATTPAAAVIGTIDDNSHIEVHVITSAGVLDPTASVWKHGLFQFKPTYGAINITPNSGINWFMRATADSAKGIVLVAASATQSADLFAVQDYVFGDLWRLDRWGRPIAAGTDVTFSLGGQGASVVAGSRGAKDTAGHAVVTAVGSPVAGTLFAVLFAHTWSAQPKGIALIANNAAAAAAGLYVTSVNTAAFTVACANAPAGGASLDVGWTVLG